MSSLDTTNTQLLHWGTKDPESVLNYVLDWRRWLQGADEITSITVTAENVTVDNASHTVQAVIVILSGGVRGETATVNIHISTSGGLQDERTVTLNIDDK